MIDHIALLEASRSYLLQSVRGLMSEELGHATPCDGWDLRAVLLHLGSSDDWLLGLFESDAPPEGSDPDVLVERWNPTPPDGDRAAVPPSDARDKGSTPNPTLRRG